MGVHPEQPDIDAVVRTRLRAIRTSAGWSLAEIAEAGDGVDVLGHSVDRRLAVVQPRSMAWWSWSAVVAVREQTVGQLEDADVVAPELDLGTIEW